MKLLQEVRGFAQLTNRRPQPRSTALLLQAHWLSRRPADTKGKRVLRVHIENPPDIPYPVKINHLTRQNARRAPAGD
jgi:hypothetical protein